MSRRDEGLISDLIHLSRAAPAFGIVLGVVAGGLGGYLYWVKPGFMSGLGPVLGIVCWLFAALVVLSAAVGFVGRGSRRKVAARRFASPQSIEDLRGLTPAEFEQAVADLFRRQGYQVTECGGRSDGGVDLILRHPAGSAGEHLVQCKRYRNWKVGVAEVREFYGAMAAHHTRCEGVFVTCGRYTAEAVAFAAGKPVRLIAGDELASMFATTNPIAPAVAAAYAPPSPANVAAPPPSPAPIPPVAPACPTCGVTMQRRTAARGKHAGRPFWGCPNFPKCRQVIDV